jgi:hypothetical protein
MPYLHRMLRLYVSGGDVFVPVDDVTHAWEAA